MKTRILFSILTLAAGPLLAADSKEELTSAAKQLAQKDNYGWKSTIEFGNFGGSTEGKTDKDGLISLAMTFGDTTREAFLKSGKAALKTDEGWQSLGDLENGSGRGRQFMVRRLQTFKAPAQEAADLVSKLKDVKQEGDVYSGDLTEAGAKELLAFGRRRSADAPEPRNAKGSVKFWLKDGMLSKYELKQQGTVTFNGEDRDIEGTTTVQIKNVGTTKIEMPDEAKKKLSS